MFANCYSIYFMAAYLVQLIIGDELAIPRQPMPNEIVACRVTKADMLPVAPTWEERIDIMKQTVNIYKNFGKQYYMHN